MITYHMDKRVMYTGVRERPDWRPVVAQVVANLFRVDGVDTDGNPTVTHSVTGMVYTAARIYGVPVKTCYPEFFEDTHTENPLGYEFMSAFADEPLVEITRPSRTMPLIGIASSPARFAQETSFVSPEEWDPKAP